MLALLSFLIVVLVGVSLGGMFDLWVGGAVAGLLFLLTYWLERALDLPMRVGRWPLALLTPLVWGLTLGVVVIQWTQLPQRQIQARRVQPLRQPVEATASLRSAQGKEVYSLKVEKDRVIYTLTLRYRQGLKLKIPKISAHPTFHGPFIMPKPPKIRFFPANKDGIIVKRWELTLVPVLTGPLDTPRFTIRYWSKGKWASVVVEPIAIEVNELGKPTQMLATLKPAKAPIPLERPTDPRQVLWFGGLGLSGLLLLLLGIWIRRRSLREPPPIPPHEWIEQALAQLNQQGLLQKGEYKRHYFALSELFRGFLERRFGFPALECTSEEIIRWSREERQLDKELARDIRQLLQAMDEIKFAGHQPDEDEQGDIERRLHSILRRTRPIPESARSDDTNLEDAPAPTAAG